MSQLSTSAVVAPQNLYTSSSTKQATIGEKFVSPDGRVFRYTKNGGTAMVRGKLYQSPAEDATNMEDLTCTATSANATSITTTSTVTLTANQCAGGYLVVVSASAGAGQISRISSHAAASGAVVTFNLEDPLVAATTGTVKIDVIPNPYDGVVVAPTTATGMPVGVAIHAVAANEYGWIQTHGIAPCLAQGTVTVGDVVIPANTTTTGTVVAEGANTIDAEVGIAPAGIASTDVGFIFLTID
jgi:hypothetical protein